MSGPAFNPDVPPVPLGPEGSLLSIVQGSPKFLPTVLTPATIPDLYYWLRGDLINGTNGIPIPTLNNSAVNAGGYLATLPAGTVTVDSLQLNQLNVLKWPGGGSGRYLLNAPVQFSGQFTLFAVIKPAAGGGTQVLLGASANGLEVDAAAGAGNLNLTKTTVAVIGSSTTALVNGTWVQFNATLNAGSGAFAFRVARAAAGSGTSATTGITGNTTGLGFNVAAGANDLSGSVAEIAIYGRILTANEIALMETYLNAKWGV